MTTPPISRFGVPELGTLPADVRERILEVQAKAGFVPNVFLALARRPDEFRASSPTTTRCCCATQGLTKGEKEMVIVATSGANQCLYRVVAHGALLRIYEKNPLVADQVAVNFRKADITPRQRAMLDFALKVHRLGVGRRRRLRGVARARVQRRRRLGHRRDHGLFGLSNPHGQPHRDAAQRRVLPDGARAPSCQTGMRTGAPTDRDWL